MPERRPTACTAAYAAQEGDCELQVDVLRVGSGPGGRGTLCTRVRAPARPPSAVGRGAMPVWGVACTCTSTAPCCRHRLRPPLCRPAHHPHPPAAGARADGQAKPLANTQRARGTLHMRRRAAAARLALERPLADEHRLADGRALQAVHPEDHRVARDRGAAARRGEREARHARGAAVRLVGLAQRERPLRLRARRYELVAGRAEEVEVAAAEQLAGRGVRVLERLAAAVVQHEQHKRRRPHRRRAAVLAHGRVQQRPAGAGAWIA